MEGGRGGGQRKEGGRERGKKGGGRGKEGGRREETEGEGRRREYWLRTSTKSRMRLCCLEKLQVYIHVCISELNS